MNNLIYETKLVSQNLWVLAKFGVVVVVLWFFLSPGFVIFLKAPDGYGSFSQELMHFVGFVL